MGGPLAVPVIKLANFCLKSDAAAAAALSEQYLFHSTEGKCRELGHKNNIGYKWCTSQYVRFFENNPGQGWFSLFVVVEKNSKFRGLTDDFKAQPDASFGDIPLSYLPSR